MSDKEIAAELLKALIAQEPGSIQGDNNETNRDISLNRATVLSEMHEIIYNKVHSLGEVECY